MKNRLKTKMDLIRVFVPIERIDEEKREVTGYAFVNEVVEGEGGVRLKRTTMQTATPDYTKWGCVREMHGNNAAGTAVEVKWDAKGALLRAKIVDDQAWVKCKEKVYKGFSVGVRALQMRGLNVEKALWYETSLVDRPADGDAIFTLVRGDATDAGGELDVDILQEEDGGAKGLKRRIKELEAQLAAAPADGDAGAVITRVKTLESAVNTLVATIKEQNKTIKRMGKEPAAKLPPVRYPMALNREFVGNDGNTDEDDTTTAELAEYNKLKESLASEPDAEKRHRGVTKLNGIKSLLMQKGLSV
jgi:hypothetical protein